MFTHVHYSITHTSHKQGMYQLVPGLIGKVPVHTQWLIIYPEELGKFQLMLQDGLTLRTLH